VLGLPPAFVLSQDQTLKLKASEDAILDRRTLHISPNQAGQGKSLSMCLVLSRDQDPLNSEADTTSSRPKPLVALICKQTSVEKQTPNRPHIPSSDILVKQRGKQIRPGAPYLVRRACLKLPEDFASRHPEGSSGAPFFVAVSAGSSFGERVFTESGRGPQEGSTGKMRFL
jgi:hypothetical protein